MEPGGSNQQMHARKSHQSTRGLGNFATIDEFTKVGYSNMKIAC